LISPWFLIQTSFVTDTELHLQAHFGQKANIETVWRESTTPMRHQEIALVLERPAVERRHGVRILATSLAATALTRPAEYREKA
jgi:hypothetical protein